ncbi:hypothetical protein ABG768_017054 [Culter alburnus]|uniref:Ig-like domain-containing protein n=1 Tax=Culter alburnus TaxID=194366 RepID=A0AAW1YWM6_CULAL
MKINWSILTELIYQYMNGQESTNNDYEDRVSLSIQELEKGNVSLTLRNVQESDSGKYICKVYCGDVCQKTATVHLQVRGKEQLQREIVELKRQMKKVKLDGQIKKLELEKRRLELEMERQIMELERRIEDLERQINELPLPTRTLPALGSSPRRRNSITGVPPRMSDDETPVTPETEEQRETRDTSGGEGQLQRQIVELKRQIVELKMEKQTEDLDVSDDETPVTPETEEQRETRDTSGGIRCMQLLLCSSSRRRNSITGVPPRMSDDETPVTPETEEQRETRDTSGVETESGDSKTTQTEEETTVTDQETPGTSPQSLQRTSTSVISPARATQTQEDPGATVQMDQERRQESESTEQE